MPTIQAQAQQMLTGLNDENIRHVICFIENLLTRNGVIHRNDMNDKMRAFKELESMHINLPTDFNPDEELEEALRKKYGNIA